MRSDSPAEPRTGTQRRILTRHLRHGVTISWVEPTSEFAAASPLEQRGFELPVPRAVEERCRNAGAEEQRRSFGLCAPVHDHADHTGNGDTDRSIQRLAATEAGMIDLTMPGKPGSASSGSGSGSATASSSTMCLLMWLRVRWSRYSVRAVLGKPRFFDALRALPCPMTVRFSSVSMPCSRSMVANWP